MSYQRAFSAYKSASVATTNQGQLINMLYDGMSRFLTKAIIAIDEVDYEVAHNNLEKSANIIMELLSTLRVEKGGEVAENLKNLYIFTYEKIVVANLKKDKEAAESALSIVKTLGEGWKSINQKKVQPSASNEVKSIRVAG